MMNVLLVFICALLLSIALWWNYEQKKLIREVVWSIVLLWLAACLSMALLLHIPMVSPADWISVIVAPIYKPVIAWIKGGSTG
ncbi:hypothetical protein [Paenibacillus chungangensis]|uniref:Holin n=1 Tax=Paenibacillus chungangensis TaxID=696535 RepID=A0ABW3HK56_9BACL